MKAHYLHDRLVKDTAVKDLSDKPFFNEFPVLLPRKIEEVLPPMEEAGFFAGVDLHRLDPQQPESALLIAVTERRTRQEMDGFVAALKGVLA
jgi:glycine dehydrogenase subunit 1